MAATRSNVNGWIRLAKKSENKFIISVCDSYDYHDYPVMCKNFTELYDKYDDYDEKNMQRINEVIQINSDGSVVENLTLNQIINLRKNKLKRIINGK